MQVLTLIKKVKRRLGKSIRKVLNLCVLNSFLDQEDYFGRVISVYIRREASELFYGGVVKDYEFFFPLALTTVFPGAFLYEASALKQTSALTLPTPNFQL